MPRAPSVAKSPRRAARVAAARSCRAARAPVALTLPPPPPAVTALAALSLLVYASARPLLARAASLYLGARVRVGGLRISPFRRAVALTHVRLHDPRGRPLLGVDAVRVSFARAPKPAPGADKARPGPRRLLDVALTNPVVVTLFDTYDFSQSNWTLFLARFSAPASPKTPPATDVRVSVVGATRLSLRSALLADARLVDDVLLPDVSVRYAELRSPGGLAAFIETLAGRAVQSARVRSFPREFRAGARRYARRVVAEGLARGIRVGRERVTTVRKGVERLDEFVFKDLPDAGGISEAVKTVGGMLRAVEGLLGGGGEEEKTDWDTDRDFNRDSPQETPVVVIPEGEAAFRELDEGDAVPRAGRATAPER